MAKQELVDAYRNGRIERAPFVRKLTALGVSLGAATTYAALLAPTVAAAPAPFDPNALLKQAYAACLQYAPNPQICVDAKNAFCTSLFVRTSGGRFDPFCGSGSSF